MKKFPFFRTLDKAVEANEAKLIQTENNYIHLVRRTTEVENENKDLRKSLASSQDKVNQLENFIQSENSANISMDTSKRKGGESIFKPLPDGKFGM